MNERAALEGCRHPAVQTDDEAMRCLKEFAAMEVIGGAQVTAIGALGRRNWRISTGRPRPISEVGEQVEVASLVGDIAIGPDGKPSVHAHAVLGHRDGSAMAGHLEEPTCADAGDHRH